jgi:hypothetical protein
MSEVQDRQPVHSSSISLLTWKVRCVQQQHAPYLEAAVVDVVEPLDADAQLASGALQLPPLLKVLQT